MSGRAMLVVSQLPPPVHGSSLMTRAFLSSMSEAGFSATLCERRYSRTVGEIGRGSPHKIVALVSLIARVCAAAVTTRPSVAVVFVTNRPASFLSDALVVTALRVFRIRVVHYVHTVGFRSLAGRSQVWELLVRRVLGAGDIVVGLGESLFFDVAPWVGRARYQSIANVALDPPASPPTAHRDEVVFFSNLLPEKGAIEFVHIAGRLAGRVPGVAFVMAGAAGPAAFMAEFDDEVTSSCLGDRLRYLGPVVGDAKWSFLAGARVHVFPSTYPFEAQPLSVIESLYVGTPVVAFRVGGLSDLAWCAHLTLVEAGDLDGLAAAVEDAMRSARPDHRTVAETREALSMGRYRLQWTQVFDDMGVAR